MPRYSGNTVQTAHGGIITRDKQGKAKTFQGSGPAPAGTTKKPEATYLTTPTVTVSGGKVSASGFASERAAERAVAATRRRRKRSKARTYLQTSRQERRRESASAEKRVEATEKAVKSSRRGKTPYKAPGTPKLSKAERKIVKAIESAKPIKPPKVEAPKMVAPKVKQGKAKGVDPAVAVMSSVPGKGPQVTRQRKQAARKELRQAKKAVRRTKPSLKGLSPEEKAVVPLARKAHRKYPDIPASLLMSLMRQESGFQADAVSSANAQGLTQFIPSTAASYGVKYGTGPKEKQSQVTGAAKLLTDSNFAENPKEALTRYTGGYSDEEYNNPVLEGAADYRAVDKTGSPKAVKRLRAAKGKAEKLGMKVAVPKGVVGPAPKKVVSRYKAIDKAATALEKAEVPYVYGGGHEVGTPKNPKAGLDCSSSTVWVLNKAGVKIPNIVSGEFGNYLPEGPGAVTVFYNEGHVFMRIGNRYWGTSRSNPKSGPGFIEGGYDEAYLSQYNVAHVPGLGKKQALQLGLKPGEVASAPGITFSNGGATATIDPGAATTQSKPGYSDKPIKLTPLEKYRRIGKRLKAVGVGESPEAQPSPTLKALEEKYKAAA